MIKCGESNGVCSKFRVRRRGEVWKEVKCAKRVGCHSEAEARIIAARQRVRPATLTTLQRFHLVLRPRILITSGLFD